ncbi:MAG: hypothetical protein V7754_17490 [Halioglobus sp.]
MKLRSVLCALLLSSGIAWAGIGTIMPISAEMATGFAGNIFPVTVQLSESKLFLSEPVVRYIDDKRIGMQVRFQAYDYRPAENIAISEMGNAIISGELAFDPSKRQVLMHHPRIDRLDLDRDNPAALRFSKELHSAWSTQVENPIRTDIPPHPYLLPFKDNIQDVSYDGVNINLEIVYE